MNELDLKVARNFRRSEFRCKRCCDKVIIQPDLPVALQELRDLLGSPVVITSGYRCKDKNDDVGGAKYSAHMGGYAADCFFPGVDLMDAYLCVVRALPWTDGGGIGLYPRWINHDGEIKGNFIHLDVRRKRKRWGQIRGVKSSFEEALLELQTGGNNEQVL